MQCRECRFDYPAPSVIDGVAYYVCGGCGNSIETNGLELLSRDERVDYFEKETGLRLPDSFVQIRDLGDHRVVSLPELAPPVVKRYFPDGCYEIGSFLGVDAVASLTILDSPALAREWGLPDSVLPIEGDGHVWLSFDYRHSSEEPALVLCFSESGEIVPVASTFDELVRGLRPRAENHNGQPERVQA